LGANTLFADLSTIPATDTIQSWTWNFGDGSPFISTQNVSHLYAAVGSYTVQLLTVSNFGCPDSTTKISIVNPKPVVNYTAVDTTGCEPLCVSFQNSSSVSPGANVQWQWNVGDGSPVINSQSFDHCYINDSVFATNFFNVTLTVTSDSGCVSTLSKNNFITVYPNPIASFTVQPETTTIIDPVISITDLSVGAVNWIWDFGDGSAPLTTSLPPSSPVPHIYSDTGTYVITLITSTQYNCLDTASEAINIESDFVFYIPNAFSPDGDGINDTFIGKGVFIKEFEMTIFDRWGNLIYKTTDINKPWDGKANRGNEIAQGDVYIYVVKITDIKDKSHSYKGVVTLVK
jgi:gliding motility-associated-like protein